MSWLDTSFAGNTIMTWILALLTATLTILAGRFALYFIEKTLKKLSEKTKTTIDDLIIHILSKTRFLYLVVLGLFFGSRLLSLPSNMHRVLNLILLLATLLQTALWGNAAISFLVDAYTRKREDIDAATRTTVSAMGFLGRLVLWSLLLLLALDNMGFDVTALITGLGIGGVAVALAVQNILSDLFASLSIVLDKPFVIGDFIIVDNYMGTVEYIGLKTTRVRSISGEQLVFANSDLLGSRIRNFKRMYERRVVTSIGVTYDTPYEKLQKIPAIIREIFETLKDARLDRVHFKALGDFALIYEIVYYVLSPDYMVYVDVEQRLNLELIRRFRDENIEFAYPTQTIVLTHASGSPGADATNGPSA